MNLKKYKKCFKTCKYCSGEGNERINNCIECASDFVFINESLFKTNCFEKCNFYYYIDEYNEFQCVQTCPEKYNKFIPNKKNILIIVEMMIFISMNLIIFVMMRKSRK